MDLLPSDSVRGVWIVLLLRVFPVVDENPSPNWIMSVCKVCAQIGYATNAVLSPRVCATAGGMLDVFVRQLFRS